MVQGFLDNQNYYDSYLTPQGRAKGLLAKNLLDNATKSEPVYGWGQALAKVLAGGTAGYLMGKNANEEQKNIQSAPGDISNAYSGAADQWKNPDSGESVGPDKNANFSLLAGKSENPFVQNYGAQFGMANINSQLDTQNKIKYLQEEYKQKGELLPKEMAAIASMGGTGTNDSTDPMMRYANFMAAKKGQTGKKTWANADQTADTQDDNVLTGIFNSKQTINIMRDQMSKMDPSQFGPGSDALNKLKQYGAQIGALTPEQAAGVASLEDFNKFAAQNVAAQARTLPGRSTVFGLNLLSRANPGSNNTLQGTKTILDSLESFQKAQEDYTNAKRQFRVANNGSTNGFNQAYDAQLKAKEDAIPASPQSGGLTIGGGQQQSVVPIDANEPAMPQNMGNQMPEPPVIPGLRNPDIAAPMSRPQLPHPILSKYTSDQIAEYKRLRGMQ